MTAENNDLDTSSFDEFISSELNMKGIGEVTCATIHPIVAKTVEAVQEQPQIEHGSLSVEARQTAACLARELIPIFQGNLDLMVTVGGVVNEPAVEHMLRFIIETGFCALIDVLGNFECDDEE